MNRNSFPSLLHPFFFSIFPALSLLAHNLTLSSYREILVPVGINLTMTALLLVILIVFRVSHTKAGLAVSMFWLLFYSFGQVLGVVFGTTYGEISRPILIMGLVFWVVILIGSVVVVLRSKKEFPSLGKLLFVISLVAVLVPAGRVALRNLSSPASLSQWETVRESVIQSMPSSPFIRPDIVYVIVDGYGREDILKEMYGIQNESFLRELEEMGFFVADRSVSNYNQTDLSLASSLNMAYLQDLLVPGSVNRIDLIQHSTIVELLKRYGYKTVSFATGYTETDMPFTDRYLGPGLALTEYQTLLLQYTPLPPIFDLLNMATPYDLHRKRISYILDHLPDTVADPGPVFVFAHLLIPHPPFVWDASCRPIDPPVEFSLRDGQHFMAGQSRDDYVKGYAGQISCLNKRLLPMLRRLIQNSSRDRPLVVLLQGDHGPGSQLDWDSAERSNVTERFSILNAYRLPGGDDQWSPGNSITPVDTFRLVCNRYFGSGLPYIPNASYFVPWGPKLISTDVTKRLGIEGDP